MRVELLLEMQESMQLTQKDLEKDYSYASHLSLFKSFKNE